MASSAVVDFALARGPFLAKICANSSPAVPFIADSSLSLMP